ncbi:MAG: D-glycerate dehydrogenase [Minwuia thermotolerans]|nr:MAG: D-glycerate dehydrogenase [Minwuia thermotolerans]
MQKKPRLLVTRHMPDNVTARIRRDYDATLNPTDRIMSPEELVSAAEGMDAMMICGSEKITPALLDALPDSVRIIATYSVGHEHIDLAAARAHGVTVTNTPKVLDAAVAEIAMLCLLGAARRGHEGQTLVREGKWASWTSTMLLGKQVSGARLGILGLGGIGQAVAAAARGFGMQVHYHNRSRLPQDEESGARYHATTAELFAVSDFLSISCPSTDETRGMVNADLIGQMPDGAVIVNTARGDIINDDDLIAALQSGKLFAAGLDVFANEPKLDPRYRTMENVFLMPHLGSASVETRDAMGYCCLDNLDAFFQGKPCPTPL